MIDQAGDAIKRHRPSAAELVIAVEDELRLIEYGKHSINRRIILNKGAVKRRRRGEVLSEMPRIKRLRGVASHHTRDD